MIVALPGLFSYLFLPCVILFLCFSSFSIAIASLGEERANLSVFCTFVWCLFGFVCFLFLFGGWEVLRLVIVAFPGLFSYLYFLYNKLISLYQNGRELRNTA